MIEDMLSRESRTLLESVERIAQEVSGNWAPVWDRENRFPTELFAALHEKRLNALTVPKEYGGLGLGPDAEDPLPVWLATRALASVDSASCHAFQVHTNMVHAVALLGTAEQKERFLRPVVEENAVLGGWGSEQNGEPAKGGAPAFTKAHRVEGGYRISGKKFYSTNAGAARFAIVFAYPDDVENPFSHLLLCMVDCRDPGVKVHEKWWDQATGMRATVSHEVELENVFVPDDWIIGTPGSYWTQEVQARYLPQFSANFQGVGRHVYQYGKRYLLDRRRFDNPLVQQRMGEAKLYLTAAELMLGETAAQYRAGNYPHAFHLSRQLRAYSELSMRRVLDLVQACCGASLYMHPHPIERMLRDWEFYSRHENVDLILGAIAKTEFGTQSGPQGPEAFGFGRESVNTG